MNPIGWNGNASEDVKVVSEKISVLKSVDECPSGKLYSGNSQETMKYELAHAIYPHHFCCKVKRPAIAETELVYAVEFFIYYQNVSYRKGSI